jgi:large subunit ribosomal protein L24
MALHVKKNDLVEVITGKDAGKQGIILKANPKANTVVVQGVHIIKKHQKPSREHQAGGIIEREAPIHVSNVKKVGE